MSDEHRELGKVTQVEFGRQAHGILTLLLDIDLGSAHVSFGGMMLDTFDKTRNRRVGHASGCDFVLRLLDLFEASSLDKIKGRYVYTLSARPRSEITGLQLPECDGGARFTLAEWREQWFPKVDGEGAVG